MSKSDSNQISLNSIGDTREVRGVVEEQAWGADWSNIQDRRQRGVDAVPDRVLHRRKIWAVADLHEVGYEEAARLLNKADNGVDVSDAEVR